MKKIITPLILCTILVFTSCKEQSKPFKIALLPDTQTYTKAYPEIFECQTQWLADNADQFEFVLQQGDITDWNAPEQWQVAQKAFNILDGKLPYTFVPGNHDIGNNSDIRNTDNMNKYLPYEKYKKEPHFGGAFEAGKMDNTWHTFKAGGMDWLILSLEFAPRNAVLEWANKVVEQHPKSKVIVNTHAYMYSDNTRMTEGHIWLPKSYGIGKDTGENAVNNGEEIWDKLVRKHKNMMLVVSGHVLHSGTGTLVSKGDNGNNVYQMLANYQWGVEGALDGKNGYMRILTFDPKLKKITVETFSPYLNKYDNAPNQNFMFDNVNLQ